MFAFYSFFLLNKIPDLFIVEYIIHGKTVLSWEPEKSMLIGPS